METEREWTATGVDYVAIPTEDAEKALTFYADVLGLERGKQWGEMPAYEVQAGNLTIALMQMDAFDLQFTPNAGPVALQIDDVAAARSELESKGVQFFGETIDSGVCFIAPFADPDGNALMLHHRYAEE